MTDEDYESASELLAEMTGQPREEFEPDDPEYPSLDSLEIVTERHDYECPGCGTAIRATNVEYLYDLDDDDGVVLPHPHQEFSEYSVSDEREQMYYCPTPLEECGIVRVVPGDYGE